MLNHRILVAIPAYNEEKTIEAVVDRVHQCLLDADLVVVNDGSRDHTKPILDKIGVVQIRHACNLGYSRALQTALKYALAYGYEALLTLDADGQHDAALLPGLVDCFETSGVDVLIGSRHVSSHIYAGVPFGRRLGMQFFSILTGVLAGQRIFDTTSGLKMIRNTVFENLAKWHFVDFHAEAIIYLLRLGYRIEEYPITVRERQHGRSMYSMLSHLTYPIQTSLMVLLGLVEAELAKRSKS